MSEELDRPLTSTRWAASRDQVFFFRGVFKIEVAHVASLFARGVRVLEIRNIFLKW